MAVFWVDSENGSDSYDGTLAEWPGSGISGPKLTAQAGLALITGTVGNTLNFISRATSYVALATGATLNNCLGSSYTNFGCLIRGTDVDGNPAIARVTFNPGVSAFFVSFTGTSRYCIVEGFDFDRPASVVNNNQQAVSIGGAPVGNIRMQYCIDRCDATHGGRMFQCTGSTNNGNIGEVRYCLVLNPGTNSFVSITSAIGSVFSFNHNVIVATTGASNLVLQSSAAAMPTTANHEIAYNTFIYPSIVKQPAITSSGNSATGTPTKTVHSNVWMRSQAGANLTFLTGASAWEGAAFPGSRTIGYNIFADLSGASTWQSYGPYQVPWDPDTSDLSGEPQFWATDVTTTSDPFNDSGMAWDWVDVNDSGYTIPLPGDYRMALYRASGLSGTVPGAIADGISVAVDDAYTFYNNITTSVAAPGVLGNDTDVGTGTADLVSNVDPAAGSVSLAANGSFTFAPTAGYNGTASFTYRIDQGGGTYSNTATVALTIVSPVPVLPFGLPIGPDSPGFLFETPEGAGASIRLARNVVLEAKQLVSFVREQITHVGGGSAEIPTATALAAVPTLSGSRVLILESDGAATVRLNSVDVPLLAGGCVLLCGADLSAILVTNDHPVRPAVVRYFGGK